MKLCLLSPLWFPLVAFPLGLAANVVGGSLLSTVSFYLLFSLFYGGVQYLITMVIVWRQIDFDHVTTWVFWVLFLPLIFTMIQLVTMVPFFVNSSGFEWLYMFGFFDLVFGYGYVGVWLTGMGLIWFVGKVRKKQTIYG